MADSSRPAAQVHGVDTTDMQGDVGNGGEGLVLVASANHTQPTSSAPVLLHLARAPHRDHDRDQDDHDHGHGHG